MRRNRRTRDIREEQESKKLIYISIIVVAIAIFTFVITYTIYSSVLNKNLQMEDLTSKITEVSYESEDKASEASNPIGKNVNEVKEESTKIAINTTNIENSVKENNNNEVKKQESQTIIKKEPEPIPDPTFIKPVDGEIMKEFAKENLVYSDTLKEWTTHNGIDIKAQKTTVVKASSEGTIKSIKNDPRYGTTIVIEHVNGYLSVYANLLTTEFVKEGEKVKQGQTIGTVGNTAAFEIADDYHLHFEILKNNEYINPIEYIK